MANLRSYYKFVFTPSDWAEHLTNSKLALVLVAEIDREQLAKCKGCLSAFQEELGRRTGRECDSVVVVVRGRIPRLADYTAMQGMDGDANPATAAFINAEREMYKLATSTGINWEQTPEDDVWALCVWEGGQKVQQYGTRSSTPSVWPEFEAVLGELLNKVLVDLG